MSGSNTPEITYAPGARPDLSVADAAVIRNCSEKTIRKYIATGDLPAYRLGARLIRIRAEDLDAFGRRVPSAKATK